MQQICFLKETESIQKGGAGSTTPTGTKAQGAQVQEVARSHSEPRGLQTAREAAETVCFTPFPPILPPSLSPLPPSNPPVQHCGLQKNVLSSLFVPVPPSPPEKQILKQKLLELPTKKSFQPHNFLGNWSNSPPQIPPKTVNFAETLVKEPLAPRPEQQRPQPNIDMPSPIHRREVRSPGDKKEKGGGTKACMKQTGRME